MTYRKVDVRIWSDQRVMALSPTGKLAFLYVLTHPGLSQFGIIRATIPGLAAEVGLTPEEFSEPFGEPYPERYGIPYGIPYSEGSTGGSEEPPRGLLLHAEKAPFVAVWNFLKYNPPPNENALVGAMKGLVDLPECGARNAYLAHVRQLAILFPRPIADRIRSGIDTLCHTVSDTVWHSNKHKTKELTTTPSIPPRSPAATPAAPPADPVTPAEPVESAPPPPKPRPAKPAPPSESEAWFESWWRRYPAVRRAAKAQCREKLLAHVAKAPDPAVAMRQLSASLESWISSRQWQEEGGRYVCAPLVWINQQRWESAPPAATGALRTWATDDDDDPSEPRKKIAPPSGPLPDDELPF